MSLLDLGVTPSHKFDFLIYRSDRLGMRLWFFAALICFSLNAWSQAFIMSDDENYKFEAYLNRKRVHDFRRYQDQKAKEAVAIKDGIEEIKAMRLRAREENEAARREYVKTVPRYDMFLQDQKDKAGEAEIGHDDSKYLALQKDFVQKRNYYRSLLMKEPQVDEMEEYGLKP